MRYLFILLFIGQFAQAQLLDRFTRFDADDSIMSLDPLVYCTPESIDPTATGDGDGVSTWNDVSGNDLHATAQGNPVLNIESGVGRQVEFDGSDWFDFSDDASLEFTPGTDEFTVIWRMGENSAGSGSGYPISKAAAAAASRMFGASFLAANSLTSLYLGGTNLAVDTPSAPANHLGIVVVETGTVNFYIDGTLAETSSSFGTADSSGQSWNIGGRTDGSFLLPNGTDMDIVAIIGKAISAGERAAIEAEFQIN